MEESRAGDQAGGGGARTDNSSEADIAATLDAFGESLAKKRSEAIGARQASGIEQQWIEDEEFYQGIDDANRDEHSNAWRTKPPGQYQTEVKGATRSTVFPNITRPYVDAAAARVADMLLPTDDRSWDLRATPIPELADISEGKIPPGVQTQLAELGDQGAVDQVAAQIQKQAKAAIDDAKAKAEKARTRIEDWQIEGQWHAEVRKVIEDAARIGTGVLKGPIPVKRKSMALVDVGPDGKPAQPQNILQKLFGAVKGLFRWSQASAKALVFKEEIKPTSKRIDPWNFFPDGACGENIHDGSGTWERDHLTAKLLEDLKGQPGYIDAQIDLCLKEGPQKAVAPTKEEPNRYLEEHEGKRFEIWYYHGTADKEDLAAAGCECGDDENPQVSVMVVMANNRVLKAALNPLDSGDFPYDVMPWQRKSGLPWGNGVARQGRTPQRITTAATRNLMDNGGLSAGPQIVIKQGMIVPADEQWTITPRKLWYAGEDSDIDDVRKAMTFFEIPSRQKELMEIIQFGMKLMEDATGLPMLLQGQQGKAPDTVGGMNILNNNATSVLRRLARLFDDCITEPHIRRYYTWLLQYGEDDEKGDFDIDARGSSALVERDMQSQQIPQLLQASGNPMFGLDPKKTMNQLLRSWHFDPKAFEFDDEKWEQVVQNMQKGGDPRVAVAQLRGQIDERLKTMDLQFELQENTKDRQHELMLAAIDAELGRAGLGVEARKALESVKAKLADTVMKLRTQKELAGIGNVVDLHKHHNPQVATPATEPPGRAPAGEAFVQ